MQIELKGYFWRICIELDIEKKSLQNALFLSYFGFVINVTFCDFWGTMWKCQDKVGTRILQQSYNMGHTSRCIALHSMDQLKWQYVRNNSSYKGTKTCFGKRKTRAIEVSKMKTDPCFLSSLQPKFNFGFEKD